MTKKPSWLVLILILILSSCLISATIRPGSSELAEPEIAVSPRLNSTPTTGEFTVDLNITDITLDNGKNGLYGWEVDMSFDPSAIEVSEVEEGPFMRNFYPPEMTNTTFTTKIDNVTGTVVATCIYFPYPPDFGAFIYGTDTLANITFQVVGPGRCTLDIYKSILNTYYGDPPPGRIEPIDHTSKDGYFQYPVGDTDVDGDVDYDDFIVLAGAYGSTIGQPAYREDADFDYDGDVDYDDFIKLAGNYGIG